MKVFLSGCLLAFSVLTAASADDFQTIIERYRQTLLLKQPGENSELTDKSKIRLWTTSLGKDGSWPDIRYDNQDRASWKASQHLDRLRIMARSLVDTNDSFHGSAQLE